MRDDDALARWATQGAGLPADQVAALRAEAAQTGCPLETLLLSRGLVAAERLREFAAAGEGDGPAPPTIVGRPAPQDAPTLLHDPAHPHPRPSLPQPSFPAVTDTPTCVKLPGAGGDAAAFPTLTPDAAAAGASAPATAGPPPASAPAAPPAAVKGRRLGKYLLLAELGAGGMGTVYRALEPDLGRQVALKTLNGAAAAGSVFVERFYREARAAARLDHPGIVRVFEVGNADGVDFFTMELVEGENLLARVRRAAPPLQERVRWIRDAALAVHHAHERGLIHRDLKPQNLMIDRSAAVKVADFGLARDTTVTQGLTVSGQILGTPHYMAPEQAQGQQDRIDARTDVYSLGATLYEVVCGTTPVDAPDVYGVLDKVVRGSIVPLRERAVTIPRDLETICMKALDLDPARRYPTARELADDLDRFLNFEAIHARPQTALEKLRRQIRRNGRKLAAGAAGALVLVAFAGALTWRQQGINDRREAQALCTQAASSKWVLANGGIPAQIRLLSAALKLDPASSEAHYRLGVVQEGIGDVHGAIAAYSRAIQCNPASTQARFRLALLFLLGGALDNGARSTARGAELVAALQREFPDDPYARLAATYCEALAWAEGTDPAALVRRLEELRDRSNVAEARYLLAGLYGFYFHPIHGVGFQDAAAIRDLDRALREIQALADQDPLDLLARMNLGLLRYELGDSARAEEDLRFVMDNARDWSDPPYFLGRVLYSQHRLPEAEALVSASADLARRVGAHEASRPMDFLILIQARRRKFDEALKTAETTLAAEPKDASAHALRAILLFVLDREKDASADVEWVLKGNQEEMQLLRDMEKDLKKPQYLFLIDAVRKNLQEFQDILFLPPKEKVTVGGVLANVMAFPRLKEMVRKYESRNSVSRELEDLLLNIPGFERELPETNQAWKWLFKRLGVSVDPHVASLLVEFWFKLAKDAQLQKRGGLYNEQDCLWRAGTWYRAGRFGAQKTPEARAQLYGKAQRDLEEAVRMDRASAKTHYGFATVLALRASLAGEGERQKLEETCADELRKARQFGWKGLEWVREDEDFATVKDFPGVREVLEGK